MNRLFKYLGIVSATGILLGIFTSFGQTYIPDPFKQLANSYSMWLIFSFAVGLALRSYKIGYAAIAGIVVQYIAILFYYVATSVRFDTPYTVQDLISLNVVWIAGGMLVGPITAIAGVLVARKTKYLPYAVAFMAGLIFSEALYQFLQLRYVGEGLIFVVAGLLFLGLMYHKAKWPIVRTLLPTVVLTNLMYIGYVYVLIPMFS